MKYEINSQIKKIIRLITDNRFRKRIIIELGGFKNMSDIDFLKMAYSAYFGEELNLENPRRFNEKIQWLKLYDRNPDYTLMVDKFLVRDYVAQLIGEEYLIPLLGVWESVKDIKFDELPNRFVLKCNHNSGSGMYICKNKKNININSVRRELNRGLKEDYYLLGREWPYKNVVRKVVCEQFMENEDGSELADYKIHCFNGVPKFILVCRDRFSETGLTEDFFDTDWKHLDIAREHSPNSKKSILKPQNLNKMLELARKLSTNIPFLRTDFYEINGKIYFGELTFFPASGFAKFVPDIWDYKIGEYLILPITSKEQ